MELFVRKMRDQFGEDEAASMHPPLSTRGAERASNAISAI